LSGKTVVGVGGMFSAGKSSFLNSLTGIELLPSDQQKCTAVATYMVAGTHEAITAYTSADLAILLNSEELQAISHQFYDSYGMGFSNIIRKMIMTLPQFEWPEIVLLDTPGYNSDYSEDIDGDDLMNDKKVAREHLSNCDYLIWLVDVENGVIPPRDMDFIKSLRLVNKALFVLNKADKKTDGELKEILRGCKQNLKEAQIPYSAITTFSSRTGGEHLGQSSLKEYLLTASQNASTGSNADVSIELTRLTKEWQGIMERKLKVYGDEIQNLQSGILASKDPRHISSLLYSYRLVLQHSANTFRQTKRLKELGQNLQSMFSKLAESRA
jgi:GTPase Era involved in 16S rRNA processing